MIREGHKLPPGIETKIPKLLDRVSKNSEVVALYAFGSLASGDLKPLSDLDFGIYCRNITELAEFIEKTIKLYLDFKFFRNAFDNAYLKGIGYSG